MTNLLRNILTGALIGYPTGFAAAAFYSQVPWAKLTPGDWGTWFGAVAAIGAFCVTLVIARYETVLRRQTARDLAIVAAASFAPAIHDIRNHLQALRSAFPWSKLLDYVAVAADLERLSAWSREDIVSLVPLGRHVASKVAMAKNIVQRISAALRHHGANSRETSTAFQKSLLELISVAYAMLEEPERVCREHGDPDAVRGMDYDELFASQATPVEAAAARSPK